MLNWASLHLLPRQPGTQGRDPGGRLPPPESYNASSSHENHFYPHRAALCIHTDWPQMESSQ